MSTLLFGIALAGPWVQDAGAVYAKGELSVFSGLPGGSAQAIGLTYADARAQAYAEIGLPEDLQVTVFAPYIAAVNRSPDTRYVALSGGDVELGLTRGLFDRPLSVELRGRLPTYNGRVARRADNYTPAISESFPLPGDGATSLDGWLHAGGSFGSGWVQGSAGYRARFGDRSDALVYDAVVGLTPAFGWLGIGVGGVTNLRYDGISQQWVAVRAIAAHRLQGGLHAEATVSALPASVFTSPGVGAALGLSWRGRLLDARPR